MPARTVLFCGFKLSTVFLAARRFQLRTWKRERESRRRKGQRDGDGEDSPANGRTEDAGCRETVRRSNTRDRSGGECPLFLLGMLRCFSSPISSESMNKHLVPIRPRRYSIFSFLLFFFFYRSNSSREKQFGLSLNEIRCSRDWFPRIDGRSHLIVS